MLTGAYPWTHRGLHLRGLVERSLVGSSIFGLLGKEYYRLAFSQNPLANLLLALFSKDIDERLSRGAFSFQQNVPTPEESFPNDYAMAYYSFSDYLGASEVYMDPGSLSLGVLDMISTIETSLKSTAKYPKGYPSAYYNYFRIEDILAGVADTLAGLQKQTAPFFSYFHLLPPHAPYNPQRSFAELFFKDGLEFPDKPAHPLSPTHQAPEKLPRLRLVYDAFIADLDHQIGVFLRALNKSGILDSSYLIVTSDHGEFFERAYSGHGSPLMYEAGIKIPLLISAPGQAERKDVYSNTSNVDLVPTLLSLAGKEIPAGPEGRLLPGFGGDEDPGRAIFTVYGKENSSFLPLKRSVVAMMKGGKKMIYYRGYTAGYDEKYELYDLQEDPEELKDLINSDTVTATRMRDELLDAAHAADRPYQRQK
jgi:hypothetical protein